MLKIQTFKGSNLMNAKESGNTAKDNFNSSSANRRILYDCRIYSKDEIVIKPPFQMQSRDSDYIDRLVNRSRRFNRQDSEEE